MRIPALTRLPNYRKFNFEPRYYDPIKEDIEERTSRIKQELRQRSSESSGYSTDSIHGAFARRASYNKSSNILQGIIMITLFVFFFGYLYFGNNILYILLLLGPIYVYFRFKQAGAKRQQSHRQQ